MKFSKDVIDSHTHIHRWFDKNGKSYIEIFDELQRETGLKGFCINALTDETYGGVATNIMAAIYKLHNPTAYAYANLFYPEVPLTPPLPGGMSPLEQYRDFTSIGFDGIKILYKPDLQKRVRLPINDNFFDAFFSKAEKDGISFLWHVADPKEFWQGEASNEEWNYADGSYPTYEELFEQTFAVLSKHPNLKVCFAHFLFLENEPEKLEEIFAKYKNVYVDLVPGLMFRRFEERPEYFKDFLTKYSDRIIFGSDAEITDNSCCAELISAVYDGITTDKIVNIWGYKSKGIDLPDEVSGKILFDNFKVLCHNTPKAIDKTALKAYIEKYSVYIKDSPEKTEILRFAQNLGGI